MCAFAAWPLLARNEIVLVAGSRLDACRGLKGELLVASAVRDWVVPLDTAGVYGDRELTFTLLGANKNFYFLVIDLT